MLVSWRFHQNQVEEKILKIVSFEGGFTPADAIITTRTMKHFQTSELPG